MSQVRLVGKNSLIGTPVLYSEVLVNSDNKLEVSASPSMSFLTYENTLLHTEFSPPFDLRGARKIRIFGNSSSDTFLQLQFATVSSPIYDWNYIDQVNPLTINGSICINYHLDTPPPYLRIANTSGQTHQLSLRIIMEK
jgi:hypothetical protein